MKIILLKDDKNLGKKGAIIEANDGYARNYILPKKIGVEASPQNLNDLKLKKANEDKLAQQIYEEACELAKVLETKTVTLSMKAGQGGKSFGSISTKEIAVGMKQQHEIEIDKKKMQLQDSIRNFGNYEVQVKLHQKVIGKFTVKVIEA